MLPYDAAVTPKAFIGGVLNRGKRPSPPSLDDLKTAGLVAPEDDPDRWFSAEERSSTCEAAARPGY